MSLNDRLNRLEQSLDHLAAHRRRPLNEFVKPPYDVNLSDEELVDQGASNEQRRFIAAIRSMDATIPIVDEMTASL